MLMLMTYFYGVQPFTKRSVHSFLDKDVEDTYSLLRNKTTRSASDEELIHLIDNNRGSYNFLPITPEQGVWEELKRDAGWFNSALSQKFCDILFDVNGIIEIVDQEEAMSSNPRKRAKGCCKNLFAKIQEKKPEITESVLRGILFESYVRYKFRDEGFENEIKRLIMPILNRQ